MASDKTWRLVSWNVNGIRAAHKKGLPEILEKLDGDVICLQETKAHPEQLPGELVEPDGYKAYYNAALKRGYSGVGVFTRHEPLDVRQGIGMEEHDTEGRVLTLEFDTFYLVNVYFPNAQPKLARLDYKLEFDRALQDYADGLLERKDVVVCGDYNVAHKEIDLANPETNRQNPGFSPEERRWMDEFLADGWVDTFRMFEQGGGHYTWWSYRFNARSRNIGWRIDYFCVNEGARDRVVSAWIEKDVLGSDHCPVAMEYRVGG
ncbi:MAG: exodeoxyribonuclease III [Desulfatibacillaceae bacterium]